MEYNTGRKLFNGTEIKLGDVLQGSQSAEVVVLWDEENKEYGVQIIRKPEFWFKLDSFLFSWGSSVKVIRSVLSR